MKLYPHPSHTQLIWLQMISKVTNLHVWVDAETAVQTSFALKYKAEKMHTMDWLLKCNPNQPVWALRPYVCSEWPDPVKQTRQAIWKTKTENHRENKMHTCMCTLL